MARKTTGIKIVRGSGNVFADLGFPDPERERFKATMVLQICRTITRRRLTLAQAGPALGIKSPDLLRLMRGSFGRFSVERLMEFLTALGHNVEVTITPTRRRRGVMSVSIVA